MKPCFCYGRGVVCGSQAEDTYLDIIAHGIHAKLRGLVPELCSIQASDQNRKQVNRRVMYGSACASLKLLVSPSGMGT